MQAPSATLVAVLTHGDAGWILLDKNLVGPERSAGALARFLQERRARALDLYMLLSAAGGRDDAVAFPSTVWARALGIDDIASPDVQISRNWSWLEEEGLVSTERRGRLRSVRIVSTSRTVAVAEGQQGSNVFAIPTAYFLANYHNRINLAGKVVLLAGLARGGGFSFVSGPPSSWHGLSRDSVKRGIRVLLTLGLLRADAVRVADPVTVAGYRVERRYALQPPFVARPSHAAQLPR